MYWLGMLCESVKPWIEAIPPLLSNKLVVNKSVVVIPVIDVGTDSDFVNLLILLLKYNPQWLKYPPPLYILVSL